MKTILIIAYECAPYHRKGSMIGAQRPYQFAKNLNALGWQVIVFCCNAKHRYTLDPTCSWKPQIKKKVQEAIQRWDRVAPLFIPLPSLKYADLIDRMWLNSVEQDAGHSTFLPKPGIWNTAKRRLATMLKLWRGDHSQSWQSVAIYAFEVFLEQGVRPDVQLAEHGPDASLFIASKIHEKYSIPFVNDFRDPVLQPIPSGWRSVYRFFVKHRLLKSSSSLINVNPAWVEMDREDFQKPAFLITNGYDPEEFAMEEKKPTKFTLAYLGNISFPTNLKVFFSSLRQFLNCQKPEHFTFLYRGNAFPLIRSLANEFGVSAFVDAGPPTDREQALRLMQQAHLLLLFSIDPNNQDDPYLKKGYYPGKVFEYFATGNPILTIPGDQGILSQLLLENGHQSIADTPEKVTSTLQKHYEYWQENKESIWKPWGSDISIYSRLQQAKKLAEILNRVLQKQETT